MSTYSECVTLYLEDEPLIALDGEMILEELGFGNIVSVSSLDEAERECCDRRFGLAILDVHLGPRKTSLGLAEQLQQRGIPTLFVTGYNSCELPEAVRGVPVVQKPFSARSLGEAVDTVLRAEPRCARS